MPNLAVQSDCCDLFQLFSAQAWLQGLTTEGKSNMIANDLPSPDPDRQMEQEPRQGSINLPLSSQMVASLPRIFQRVLVDDHEHLTSRAMCYSHRGWASRSAGGLSSSGDNFFVCWRARCSALDACMMCFVDDLATLLAICGVAGSDHLMSFRTP